MAVGLAGNRVVAKPMPIAAATRPKPRRIRTVENFRMMTDENIACASTCRNKGLGFQWCEVYIVGTDLCHIQFIKKRETRASKALKTGRKNHRRHRAGDRHGVHHSVRITAARHGSGGGTIYKRRSGSCAEEL